MRVERAGGYLTVIDDRGCRHLIRIGSIQCLSDGDPCQDTTVVVVAGRPITVPVPLDTVLDTMTGGVDGGGSGR